MKPPSLKIIALTRNRYIATCGYIDIPEQPTKNALLYAMKQTGIDLGDYNYVSTSGTEFPFIIEWVKKK